MSAQYNAMVQQAGQDPTKLDRLQKRHAAVAHVSVAEVNHFHRLRVTDFKTNLRAFVEAQVRLR
jgi:sorting nexin-like protein